LRGEEREGEKKSPITCAATTRKRHGNASNDISKEYF
jgi:hypothetical protein